MAWRAVKAIMVNRPNGSSVVLMPGDELPEDCVDPEAIIEAGDVYDDTVEDAPAEDDERQADDGGGDPVDEVDLTAGTIPAVLARVESEPDTAQATLDAELAKGGSARSGLVSALRDILGL